MQTQDNNQLDFSAQAYTFSLKMVLKDQKLNIILKDYVDWIIYSKEYVKPDPEIPQKMGLSDVFNAFFQTQNSGLTFNKDYVLGTAVKFGDYPAYKISQGGKITAFKTEKTKDGATAVYQSNLSLTKVREMSDVEIQVQQMQNQFDRYIVKSAKNDEQHTARIKNVEDETKSLQGKINLSLERVQEKTTTLQNNLKNQMDKFNEDFETKINKLISDSTTIQSLTEKVDNLTTAKQNHQGRIVTLQNQYIELSAKLEHFIQKIEQENMEKKLQQTLKNVKENLQKLGDQLKKELSEQMCKNPRRAKQKQKQIDSNIKDTIGGIGGILGGLIPVIPPVDTNKPEQVNDLKKVWAQIYTLIDNDASLNTANKNIVQKFEALQQKLNEQLISSTDNLKESLNTQIANQFKTIQDKIPTKDLEEKVTKIQKTNEQASQQIKEMAEQIKNLQTLSEQASKNHKELKDEIDNQIKTIQDQITNKDKDIEQKMTQNETAIKTLTDQIAGVLEQIKTLNSSNSQINTQINSMLAQINSIKQQKDMLPQMALQIQNNSEQLAKLNLSSNSIQERMTQQINNIKGQFIILDKSTSQKVTNLNTILTGRINELTSRISNIEANKPTDGSNQKPGQPQQQFKDLEKRLIEQMNWAFEKIRKDLSQSQSKVTEQIAQQIKDIQAQIAKFHPTSNQIPNPNPQNNKPINPNDPEPKYETQEERQDRERNQLID